MLRFHSIDENTGIVSDSFHTDPDLQTAEEFAEFMMENTDPHHPLTRRPDLEAKFAESTSGEVVAFSREENHFIYAVRENDGGGMQLLPEELRKPFQDAADKLGLTPRVFSWDGHREARVDYLSSTGIPLYRVISREEFGILYFKVNSIKTSVHEVFTELGY